MNYTPNLLKILGINIASTIIDGKRPPEQRLFQAIILQAFEDALNTQSTKQESYFKKDAHDWFLNGDDEFQSICWYAGFDPEVIHDCYKKLIKKNKIVFTKTQKSWIEYRDLYKQYRAAKNSAERRSIMLKIVKVNLGRNSS